MANILLDGGYSKPGGLEVGSPIFEHPFEQNGDVDALIITRAFKQTRAAFRVDRLSGAFVPGRSTDPELPDAYLMATSRPVETRTGLLSFTRTYARIPGQQIAPSSIMISFPNPAGTETRLDQVVNSTYVTIGTCTASGSLVLAKNKLFPTPRFIEANVANGGNRRVTITGHGFNPSEPIMIGYIEGVSSAENYFLEYMLPASGNPSYGWQVVDANTIDLLGRSGSSWNTGAATNAVCAGSPTNYTAGTRTIRCSLVTDFYLPGVSAGIATADDIPLPDYEGDRETMINALMGGAMSVNYEVGQLRRWRDWPILELTKTVIAAGDL